MKRKGRDARGLSASEEGLSPGKEGAIPSGNVENSDEFTHNPIHPAAAGADLSFKKEGEGAVDETRTDLRSKAAVTSKGCQGIMGDVMSPGSIHSD